jgi:hypothetical protein
VASNITLPSVDSSMLCRIREYCRKTVHGPNQIAFLSFKSCQWLWEGLVTTALLEYVPCRAHANDMAAKKGGTSPSQRRTSIQPSV